MPDSVKASEIEEVLGVGKLVALEGEADIISTQLRLLPPSQKILILPSILDSLPKLQGSEALSARSFVQHVHQLFTERTQHAQSFLGSSTSMHPRLVFTHGGSINARSICITWITESVTDGNYDQAEVLFNEIVKDGVAGLMRCEEKEEDSNSIVAKDLVVDDSKVDLEHTTEDASTTAMRAAESLDRETAGLESDQHADDTEDTLCGETLSLGHDGFKEFYYQVEDSDDDKNMRSETPLMSSRSKSEEPISNTRRNSRIPVLDLIFTASEGEEIKRIMLALPSNASLWDRRNTSGTKIPQLTPFSTASYSSVPTTCERSGSMIDDDFDIQSPETDLFPSTPIVVYGEACLVDMQSNASDSPPLRKVKSVDRMFPALLPVSHSVSSPKSLRQTASFCHPQARPMTSESGSAVVSEYFQAVPRTTFVKASETTIRRSPTSSNYSVSSSSSIRAPLSKTLVTVDQGTTVDVPLDTTSADQQVIFEPVFPAVEDLIINLNPTGSNVIFDAVLASYKSGSYPVLPTAERPIDAEAEDEIRDLRISIAAQSDIGYTKKRLTYDPYDYKSTAYTQWPLKHFSKYRRSIHQDSSTPLKADQVSDRIIDFSPLDSTNAVTLQNSLRQILSGQFPTCAGYSQHLYTVTDDMERLWKPVFKINESGSIAESSRTVDQIVALGCEIGVKQDFFTQISGQIERLGTKKNGMSRSGRMDIKYFIANVMQNLPNSLTTPVDSTLSPDILAQLIVPQLESFLSTNSSTRFLILHYTASHLGVVLALQKIIGAGVFQVAGILDTLSSDPPSFSQPRTPREINPLSNEATMSRPTSRRATTQPLKGQLSGSAIPPLPNAKPQVSFSKANYLIPSIATDAEITIFLSGIWKALMERSSYYNPELPEVEIPKPTITTPVIQPTTPRLTSAKSPSSVTSKPTVSSNDKTSHPPSSYRALKSDKIARMTGRDGEVRYAKSIAASVRTTASEKGRREDKEWENFYIADEDSEDDDYDKMIMGREFKRILPEQKMVKKRNTKKALKWLGLN